MVSDCFKSPNIGSGYISDYHSCWSAGQSGLFTQAKDDFSSKEMGFNHSERLKIHLKTRPGQPFDSSLWLDEQKSLK